MELKHYLLNKLIDEPIGFDAFETKISRGDYHGISAEVSTGDLEFYGSAYNIILNAFYNNIDEKIEYTIKDSANNQFYAGILDLTTCTFHSGEYNSVSCKVGEIGVKTTFNNRTETDVDLLNAKTIDGHDMELPAWKDVFLPSKHLVYTNKIKQRDDKDISTIAGAYSDDVKYYFSLDDVLVNEFGNLQNDPVFVEDADFNRKFGTGTKMRLVADIVAEIKIVNVDSVESDDVRRIIRYAGLRFEQNAQSIVADETYNIEVGQQLHINCDISNLTTDYGLRLFFYYKRFPVTIQHWEFVVTIKQSSIKMYMLDNLPDESTIVPVLPVFEALDVVTKSVTNNGLQLKSNWYGRPDMLGYVSFGGGALKAITNGYKIRGVDPAKLIDEEESEDAQQNIPVTFKGLITSLNALDCIGWGFSQESGITCLRVENWDWFYKADVIVSFDNIPEVTKRVNADSIITSFTIGFQKYYTNTEYNSIDSIHSERTYSSPIKAVKKAVTAKCDWIADNYAIEETRRAAENLTDRESFKYDENLFVFELLCRTQGTFPSLRTNYYIGNSSLWEDSEGFFVPEELINAKLSPMHCAFRWHRYLIRAYGLPYMNFASGKVNYRAKYAVCKESFASDVGTIHSLKTYPVESEPEKRAQNVDITGNRLIGAEEISFNAPVSIEQYKAIKANPYGLISVNGMQGWIKDFTFNFHDGLGTFTLISK